MQPNNNHRQLQAVGILSVPASISASGNKHLYTCCVRQRDHKGTGSLAYSIYRAWEYRFVAATCTFNQGQNFESAVLKKLLKS